MRKIICLSVLCLVGFVGCGRSRGIPVSASGVTEVRTKVSPGSDGLTVEQRNVKKRLDVDNTPGAIKHLYVISAMSGQVIIYSTVDGKVTSGKKRLTPTSVYTGRGASNWSEGIRVNIGGANYTTSEVLQDDGTYGSSMNYLYWFDKRGAYHQHYVTGGQIVHVSDQPIAVPSVILNMELGHENDR